jgi:hypothetical protein
MTMPGGRTEILPDFTPLRISPRGWSQPIWQRPLILLGFPESHWPRDCQAILSQVRGEQGVVALDEGHAMWSLLTRNPDLIAVK